MHIYTLYKPCIPAYDSLYNYFILFNAGWFYPADTYVYTQELKLNNFVYTCC